MQFHWRLLTGEQVRAARSLARIEQAELARRTQLSVETIKRLERIRGPVDANIRTLNAIGAAFEQIGIRFDSGDGGGEGVWRVRELQVSPQRVVEAQQPTGRELHRLIYHGRKDPVAGGLGRPSGAGPEFQVPPGLSGAGFERDGRILQAIEGEAGAVRQLFGAIASDPRHAALTILENRPVLGRLFSGWSDCLALSAVEADALRQERALIDGFSPETLSPASALGLLIQVGELRQQEGERPGARYADSRLALTA